MKLRILTDNGIFVDMLSWNACRRMGIEGKGLSPINAPLNGFAGGTIVPLGIVQVCLTLGTKPTQMKRPMDFLVVDNLLAYNIILGRPMLNVLRAIP